MTDISGLDIKYRPQDFSELKGQRQVTEVVKQHLKEGSLPKSLLFFGPPGSGKTSLARLIAKELNPHSSGLIEKDSALDGKVDMIRGLQSEILHFPMEGEYKTYIFDEAHRISSAGFDSLLKKVEEPPDHARFIFVTTNREQIPATIQSRCELHQFNRIPNEIIKSRIKEILKKEKIKLPETLIGLTVEAGDGSLRGAIISLQKILTLHSEDQTEIEITKSLGIISSKNLSNFIFAFLFQEYFELRKYSKLFSPETVDPIKAIHNLQQFTADLRHGFATPDLVPELKSNIEVLLSKILERGKGKEFSNFNEVQFKRYIGNRIHKLWEKSIDLEVLMRKTSNKSAVVEMIPIELAMLWKDA